jgi:hypothetical protein
MAESIRLVNPSTGAFFDFRGEWLRSSPATDQDVRMGRAKFRGDKVYLRLPPGVQAQLDKGVLEFASAEDRDAARRPVSDPVELPGMTGGVPAPAWHADHEEWRRYAITMGLDADAAAGMTRDQIQAQFAAVDRARDDAPLVEALDGDPEARAARRRR